MFLLRCVLWNLLGSFLGTCTLAPKYPLERNIWDANVFRLRHDQPRHVCGKLLAMGPFLYSCFSYTTTQCRGELSIAQGDTFPRTEDVQQRRQAVRHGDSFRASFGLDR